MCPYTHSACLVRLTSFNIMRYGSKTCSRCRTRNTHSQNWADNWRLCTQWHKHCIKTFQNTNLMHNSFILQQYICYITLLNMFRAARCSSSGGPVVSPQPLVSSPSVSSRKICGWRADCSPLSTRILYGCLQRVTIPEAVVIQLVLLRMSSVLLETCWGA